MSLSIFKNLLTADISIAGRTIWGEARGQSYDHKVLIAHVLLNRWIRTDGQFAKDDTLATTCLRHVQFSVWTKSDPNFDKLFTCNIGDRELRNCIRAVYEAIEDKDGNLDPSQGATHYHTIAKPSWASQWPPNWAEGHLPCVIEGAHAFYNDVP